MSKRLDVGDAVLWSPPLGGLLKARVVGRGRDDVGPYVEVEAAVVGRQRVHRSQLRRLTDGAASS